VIGGISVLADTGRLAITADKSMSRMERIRPIPDSQRIANSLKRLLLEDSGEIAGIQKSQRSETSASSTR
jgi:hypothetical protein